MSDDPYDDPNHHPLLDFVSKLRQMYVETSGKSTLAAMQEFDEGMRPLVIARAKEIQLEESANQPTQAEMLMELVLEVEQVVSLVPPRLAQYRRLLAAEGLDKTVVPVHAGAPGEGPDGPESGREGMPGINLADQASLEFHSQLLQLSFAIAQDEVQQRMQRRAQTPDRP